LAGKEEAAHFGPFPSESLPRTCLRPRTSDRWGMADSKSAGEILEAVVKDGREELDRASLGLTFSGVAAGFNISFSAGALGIVGALTGGVGLAAYLVYPLGFLIVILGRAQVFTENTVTPGTVALTDPRAVPNMLRLWVVVFVTNILGATLFSAVTSTGTSSSSALCGSCSRRPPTRPVRLRDRTP
jgi:formate/nitrite transporter FocA (FNT family)